MKPPFGSEPVRAKVGARDATLLSFALWGVGFVIFVGSDYASYGHEKGREALLFLLQLRGAFAAAGVLMSAGLYAVLFGAARLRPPARVAVIAAAALAAAALHAVAAVWIEALLLHWHYPKATLAPFMVAASFNYIILVWLHGLYAAALSLGQIIADLRQRELQLTEARGLAQQAQIAALRFQLNPHFLFNTLNAVSTLVVTGRNPDAETMIGRLCEFLRASLASDPNATTALSEELATIEAYLEIETVRFGERLQVEIACPPALQAALVPTLVLQPLVENAVKYAVATTTALVKVRIEVAATDDELSLTVADDGDARAARSARPGTGVGLENARRRLVALYGPRGGLEAGRTPEGGWRTVIRLPLQTAETTRKAA